MATRFYLCEAAGSGTPENPYHPAIADYSTDWDAVDYRLRGNGSGYLIVRAEISDNMHNQATNDSRVFYIPWEAPNGNLLGVGDTLDQVDSGKLSNIQNFLETHHIPTQGITLDWTIGQTMAAILRRALVKQRLQEMDFSNFSLGDTVGDIPANTRQTAVDRLQAAGVDTSGITLDTPIRGALLSVMQQKPKLLTTYLDD